MSDEAKLKLAFSNGPLLINTKENHYKFWYYDIGEQKVYWGRIDQKFQFKDVSDKTRGYINDKIFEKLNKGYDFL